MAQTNLVPVSPLRQAYVGRAAVRLGNNCFDKLVARSFGVALHVQSIAPVTIGSLAIGIDSDSFGKPNRRPVKRITAGLRVSGVGAFLELHVAPDTCPPTK